MGGAESVISDHRLHSLWSDLRRSCQCSLTSRTMLWVSAFEEFIQVLPLADT